MEPSIFIPTNYTDAGKLFGMFEIRNVIECVILCIPLVLLTILLSPFGITGTIRKIVKSTWTQGCHTEAGSVY